MKEIRAGFLAMESGPDWCIIINALAVSDKTVYAQKALAAMLKVSLVSIVPPHVGAALVARYAFLARVFLVEELQSSLDALGVGVVGIAAVDDAAHAFLGVHGTVALVDERHEEARVSRAALLSPRLV